MWHNHWISKMMYKQFWEIFWCGGGGGGMQLHLQNKTAKKKREEKEEFLKMDSLHPRGNNYPLNLFLHASVSHRPANSNVFLITRNPPRHPLLRCCPVAVQDGCWCLWRSAPGSHSGHPSTSTCRSSPLGCLCPAPPTLPPSQSKTPPAKPCAVQLLCNNTVGTIKPASL